MEKLMNKNRAKKIFIAIIIVLLFNFIMPTYSRAEDSVWGGLLLDPIVSLFSAIGDAVLGALQYFMYDGNASLNGASLFGLLTPNQVFSASAYGMQADEAEITEPISESMMNELGFWKQVSNWWGDLWNVDSAYKEHAEDSAYGIPILQYTPDKIFSNQIPALDINFIDPREWEEPDRGSRDTSWLANLLSAEQYAEVSNLYGDGLYGKLISEWGTEKYVTWQGIFSNPNAEDFYDQVYTHVISPEVRYSEEQWNQILSGDYEGYTYEDVMNRWVVEPLYNMLINSYTETDTNPLNERSITQALHSTIASWYVVLRNLAIIALLSVLVYVGIRMVISSTAADKAKYKQMLMDWIIALCIVFFLHYLMSFIITFVETLVEGISNATDDIVVGIYTDDTLTTLVTNYEGEPLVFKTDLTGLCRFRVQSKDMTMKLVYLIFYIALVIYTVMFTWTYLKRALTIAFLTLMAPLVAITYPIDKMRDGEAQAFNIWLKEFMFNAMLQPFHLIIYTIFLGSAMNIAVDNPIYAILFLAFMTKCEGLLRKMFGFENSQTAGAMGAAAGMFGGAAVLSGTRNLIGKIGSGGKGSKGGGESKKGVRTKDSSTGKVTDSNKPSISSAFGGGGSNGSESHGTSNVMKQYQQDEAKRINALSKKERRKMMLGAIASKVPGSKYVRKVLDYSKSAREMAGKVLPQPVRRAIKGATKVAGRAAVGATKGAAKFAGKAAVTAGGLALGGIVGTAAGITGDDMEDVLKMGATGAGIGGVATNTIANATGNFVTQTIPNKAREAREIYEQGAYGPEEAALRAQQRDLMNDEEYKQTVTRELSQGGNTPSKSAIRQAMRTGTEYYNAGITDYEDIMKAMKTEQDIRNELQSSVDAGMMTSEEANSHARDQAKVIAKISSKVTASDLRNKEQTTALQEGYKIQLKNSGMTDKDATKQAETILNRIKKFKGV